MFKCFDNEFINEVETRISEWNLSKSNKTEFLQLRNYYNNNLSILSDREKAVILYCLLTHAFNYQIAFNSKNKYNMPSGAGRSYFSPQLKKKLVDYIHRKNEINIDFINKDFTDITVNNLPPAQDTFIYADPPYLITTGAYERDYYCKWSEEYEIKLLDFLDVLNKKGYKFALSNVLEHKGKSNDLLKIWSEKYNVHYLNMNYKNCNYQTKDKSANSSLEVLITNY